MAYIPTHDDTAVMNGAPDHFGWGALAFVALGCGSG